ncbi:MAG: nucleotide exchange factor GrpE [Alphaproteobacteria bacterium]|nr:nucleotide exchange factor GrpE [Alphaproteobacteria bacterium]
MSDETAKPDQDGTEAAANDHEAEAAAEEQADSQAEPTRADAARAASAYQKSGPKPAIDLTEEGTIEEMLQEAAASEEPEATPRELELEAQLAETKDQMLRALAEAENTRKRAERDRDELRKYGAAALARDLLSVADNLRRALDSVSALALDAEDSAVTGLIGGIEMTEKELLAAFEKHAIKKLTPVDEPFDPNLHQAMYEVPGTGKPAGTVVELMQPGYVLHDRLLRAAMVGVAKAEESNSEPTDEPADSTA